MDLTMGNPNPDASSLRAWQAAGTPEGDAATAAPLPERTLFWGMNGQFAVREGPWKLVLDPRSTAAKSQGKTQGKSRTEATPPRLFRLDQDLAESTDLSASEPEKTAALLQKLDLWKAITARPLAP